MTGEMSWIKANGEDSNGDVYDVHARVAKALKATLRPFDVYIGPYISTPQGKVFITSEDGFSGDVCLWVGGCAPAYREPIVAKYAPFNDVRAACKAARAVLAKVRGSR